MHSLAQADQHIGGSKQLRNSSRGTNPITDMGDLGSDSLQRIVVPAGLTSLTGIPRRLTIDIASRRLRTSEIE